MSAPHPLVPALADPSHWLAPTVEALEELVHLPENWSSYGAGPVDPKVAVSAIRLLATTMREDTPAPIVVPTNRGGVLLEWHLRGVDLEVETLSTGHFHVYFEDHTLGKEWEGEIRSDLPR